MSFKSSFTIPAVAAISLCLIGGTTPASADLGDQLFKLLADDGAADDNFGLSVAISGTTAIVGAWWHDDNGSDSGSAYLFDATTGQQITKLLPDDGAANERVACRPTSCRLWRADEPGRHQASTRPLAERGRRDR